MFVMYSKLGLYPAGRIHSIEWHCPKENSVLCRKDFGFSKNSMNAIVFIGAVRMKIASFDIAWGHEHNGTGSVMTTDKLITHINFRPEG